MTTLQAKTPVFLDTNIVLRFDILETPEHQAVREGVAHLIAWDCTLWINRQVIREYCRAVTHPAFPAPLAMADAVARVRQWLPYFNVADETESVTEQLLQLLENTPIGGKKVHDANIAATMLAFGITHLLTLNTPDFTRFEPQITVLTLNDLNDESTPNEAD